MSSPVEQPSRKNHSKLKYCSQHGVHDDVSMLVNVPTSLASIQWVDGDGMHAAVAVRVGQSTSRVHARRQVPKGQQQEVTGLRMGDSICIKTPF